MPRYSDFRNNLDIHPVNGDLIPLNDEAAITNQIKNIIFTGVYETFWKPNVGAGIPQTLFENFTYDSITLIENKVRESINNYVKRAKLILVSVRDGSISNQYSLKIVYRPINLHEDVTLNIILKRVR